MAPSTRILSLALLSLMIVARPARATWIEGKVYCDDGDKAFSAGDTPIDGVEVKAVSQTASPGTILKDTTGDAVPVSPAVPGYYRILLPQIDDTYIVMLTGVGVPAGASVIIPNTGQYSVFIDSGTGDPSNARKTRNFLLDNCTPPTTSTTCTTSSTSSTSTSHTTTTHTTSSTSTSSTSSTSSTTSTSSTSSSSSSSSTTSSSTTSTTAGTTPLQFCEDTVDHLKCYRTRRLSGFQPNGLILDDQFGTSAMTLLRPYRLCNPVDKNGEGIVDPTEHQMCYQIRATGTVAPTRFPRRDVLVENQFGKQVLVVTRPETLCTPAEKDGITSDLNGDRMKCYRVVQKVGQRDFVPLTVTLKDQFESKNTTVLKPILLCNPTSVDGSEINSPTCHQVCYRIEDVAGQPEFTPVSVTVKDEFYDRPVNPFRGECRQVSLLCVPSLKTELND